MDERDDFWNLDRLVPKKEKPKYISTRHDTEAVEITDGEDAEADATSTVISRVIKPRKSEETVAPDDEYTPESPLISRVAIYRWKNGYNYYEQFCEDAKRLAAAVAPPCEHVPFFSYVPQYVQLSRAQLCWYLHWRGRVFAGEYPKTDYSYILLLIFEIINLAENADTKKGQKILCELWLNYRDEFPRLDRYLCEWICDYSLIHHLPPPLGFLF